MAFPNAQVPNQMLAKTPQGLGSLNPTSPQQNAYQVQPETNKQTNMPGGFGGQGGFNQPQVQQALGGFGQQKMQQAQPQMITAQLQGQIMAQPQQLGGMGGGFNEMTNTKPSPLQAASIGAPGPNTINPDFLKAMQSLQGSAQAPQGLGGLAAYGPQAAMYKAGGSVEMHGIAQKLASQGRHGDTMLAHINPQEAGILSALGGSGTINPHTGLPEYWSLNPVKLVKKGLSALDDAIIHPITHAVQNVVQDVAKATGPVGQIVASAYGGPLGAALYAGLAGEDGFNFKRGLMAGAMTWGAQNLAEGLGGTEGASSSTPTPPPPGPEAVGLDGLNATPSTIAQTGLQEPSAWNQLSSGDISGAASTTGQNISNAASSAWDSASNAVTNAWNDPSSLVPKNALYNQDMGTVASNAGKVLTGDTSAWTGSLTKSALPMFMGATGIKAIDEMEKFKKEQEELQRKQDEETKLYNKMGIENLRQNPWQFAEGGAVDDNQGIYGQADGLATGGSPINYAAGGTTPPRFLSGGGDGMSDSIPATIDGKQPARIADGEFIVPADVVSHLGNGSSKAGAKQLYSMMDKVRAARTGTTKQGKQINPKKYLPA